MKLFSKRNRSTSSRNFVSKYDFQRLTILSNDLRNRLAAVISFLSSRDDFLEFFILLNNKQQKKKYLDETKTNGFSLAELGYKMSDFFQLEEDFAIKELSYTEDYPKRDASGNITTTERKVGYFDDYKLFDLIEFIIIFSKKSKRLETIKRFNDIFGEENSEYEIINGMITKKTGENITTLRNILKDENLQQKIADYEYYWDHRNYVNTAKISAEIINLIFSCEEQDKKKKTIEKILEKLANCLSQGKSKSDQLHGYINALLTSIKNFNNNIYNIRHTEKSAIRLKNGDLNILYKLISQHNISMVETVLVTLKKDFTFSEDWEVIKKNYIEKYQINPNARYIIEDVSITDLPF
jgi:hypothetical protein